jgi:hypothetical protein
MPTALQKGSQSRSTHAATKIQPSAAWKAW